MALKKSTLLFSALILIVLTAGTIDLGNLFNYANQSKPNYINKDNTGGNTITDPVATLGRVLFYDKKLSVNNTISCSSCHKQEFAFGDAALQSLGVAGNTARHSMRLANARFGTEVKFFWDERAANLEIQTSTPIQDHVEMGFSGSNGDPGIDSLIAKLSAVPYYNTLFDFAFGSQSITETKMQIALAQFVRSIQSFDSKFDIGLAATNGNINAPFPNYTASENAGKQLFLAPPPQGAGCQGCHRAPEFDIDPNSKNNNILGNLNNPNVPDLTVTRAPSLRNVVGIGGSSNGNFMHDGSLTTLLDVVNHYNAINYNPAINTNLDPRLIGPPPGNGQHLNLTETQKSNLVDFLKTLSGDDVYTNEKWSNPFDANGNVTVLPIGASPTVIIDGKTKIMIMDTITSGEYVIVRQADGTLALRKNKLTVSATNDTLFNGFNWVIIPGISAANNN